MTESEIMDEMYDQLMEHSSNSVYHHQLKDATHSLHGHNPSCGDNITLQLKIENNKITDASFLGSGCVISQSSTSIMLQTLIGKRLSKQKKLLTFIYL